MKVTVALSGGKDSTAAVLLLRQCGHEVRAATMRLGIPGEEERLARIEKLARVLAVPWEVVDLRQDFQQEVIAHFLSEYRRGRTPNPCMVCNRAVKFGLLLERLLQDGAADLVATGHYAAVAESAGSLFLSEPLERRKSQIYFLSRIEPAVLGRILFPLAALTLEQVREKVDGLPLANPEESQDVCFLAGRDLLSFLQEQIPESFAPGDILDVEGRVIGSHAGVIHFTVGQRRGTRYAAGRRYYVIGTDVEKKTVTLGEARHLLADGLTAADPVYWRPIRPGEHFRVKIRYQSPGEEAEIVEAMPASIRVRFRKPVRAVTPGQFAVFYEGSRIVASGAIVP